MTNRILALVCLCLALFVNADRTEQGNLLTPNNFTINGEADGVVTINLGPLGTPPTLKCKSDKNTNVGVQLKPSNDLPTALPANQGLSTLGISGYGAIQITSSNPDAKCEYELITIDLSSFFSSGTQTTGIMCHGCGGSGSQSSTGGVMFSSTGAPSFSSSASVMPSSSAGAVLPSSSTGIDLPPTVGVGQSSSAGVIQSSSAGVIIQSSSAGAMQSSSAGVSQSSTGGVVQSSTGVTHSSTGQSGGGSCVGGCWQSIPCQHNGGQITAKFEEAATYVFVSIDLILQAVFNTPCDIIAGLNRTIEWAEDFSVQIRTQTQNQLQCQQSTTTTVGDANQRHRDCGDDMDHFYTIGLATAAQVETTLVFKYTSDLLIQKGKCGDCGKNLHWAYYSQTEQKWRFPDHPSQVDEANHECRQNTTQPATTWGVMYSTDAPTDFSSSGVNGGGDRSSAETVAMSLMTSLALLSLYLVR